LRGGSAPLPQEENPLLHHEIDQPPGHDDLLHDRLALEVPRHVLDGPGGGEELVVRRGRRGLERAAKLAEHLHGNGHRVHGEGGRVPRGPGVAVDAHGVAEARPELLGEVRGEGMEDDQELLGFDEGKRLPPAGVHQLHHLGDGRVEPERVGAPLVHDVMLDVLAERLDPRDHVVIEDPLPADLREQLGRVSSCFWSSGLDVGSEEGCANAEMRGRRWRAGAPSSAECAGEP
jgi:hypothetical protein